MEDLNVYIITSDKTCDKILEISLYYWKKYWKNGIVVLGFNKGKDICEKFDNVMFFSLGKTQNINEWTYYLYKYFSKDFLYKTIILSLDDFFPLKPIDYEYLAKINNKVLKEPLFVKACLAPSFYLNDNDLIIDGYRCSIRGNYMFSLQLSLWDVEYLKDIFINKLSPWKLELLEKRDDKIVIKTTNIHSNIFDIPIKKDFICKSVVRTNTSSHLSSPYNSISLLGLSYKEIKDITHELNLDEKHLSLGHRKNDWFMCNCNDICDNNFIVKKWKALPNERVKTEYYYLYNDIYDLN